MLARGGAASETEDDGRIELVGATTLASFYAGFVFDDVLNEEDFKSQVLTVAVTTAIGFASSLIVTRGHRVDGGVAESYTLGLEAGIGNGLLLAPLLGITAGGPANGSDGIVNQNGSSSGSRRWRPAAPAGSCSPRSCTRRAGRRR